MGLMGEIAATVYNGLGEESVIGVIPEALQPREVILIPCECVKQWQYMLTVVSIMYRPNFVLLLQISGETVGEIRIVPDMHTRKVGFASAAQPDRKPAPSLCQSHGEHCNFRCTPSSLF